MIQPTETQPQAAPAPTSAPVPPAVSPNAPQTTSPQATLPLEGGVAEPRKPDYLSDEYWDADKKAPKVDALAGKLKELTTAQQADEARKASLPKTANDYKVELPADFKMPEGMQIDLKDPAWVKFAEFAHAHGLDQKQFSDAAGLYTQLRLGELSARAETAKQEFAKLGDNGKARVQAVHNFIDSAFPADQAGAVKESLISTATVTAWEQMQARLASAGITSFSQSGRDGAAKPGEIPGYKDMSFEQKWLAGEQSRKARAA